MAYNEVFLRRHLVTVHLKHIDANYSQIPFRLSAVSDRIQFSHRHLSNINKIHHEHFCKENITVLLLRLNKIYFKIIIPA